MGIEGNYFNIMGFLGGSVGEESSYKAGDMGLIPGLGRSPGEGNGNVATHSRILAWEIPWTEESGRLQSIGSQRARHDLTTKTATYTTYEHVYI